MALALVAPVAAQSPLDAVADSLGGAGAVDAVSSITTRLRGQADLAGRAVRIRVVRTVTLPDRARIDVRIGGTGQTLEIGPDSSVVRGEPGRRLRPAEEVAGRQSVWLDPFVLVARRREVTVERLDADLLRLSVPSFPEPVLLRLGPEGWPRLLSTFRSTGEAREYLEVRYTDYREVDGLMHPHHTEQAVGGVVTGTVTVESVRLEH